MSDYFEIDFLDVETAKSGDAIAIRYELEGETFIHVVDGGYLATGDSLVTHIRDHYGSPKFIDNVVVTHQDGDHTAGLRTVLEEFDVGALWMLRPWTYAADIIDRVKRFTSVEGLAARLKADFPNLAALEEIAIRRGIPIKEPFQGASIGAFTALAPSKGRYLQLILDAERTPDEIEESSSAALGALTELIRTSLAKAANFVRSVWGEEVFSTQETSVENEMSVVQGATLMGERILLTGDVGRGGLAEAADYAPYIGWTLPGINRFQVPHHGGRRNVNTELLDRWLGPKFAEPSNATAFTAIISAAKADEHHPRKAVVRAIVHRGGRPFSTETGTVRTGSSAPPREGWGPVSPLPYPEDQEE